MIRKGLEIGYTESVRGTVGDWFDEASKLMMHDRATIIYP